jgi:catechol 2,3-dioxygenase-like lactoylglutathione lyase family enzyme
MNQTPRVLVMTATTAIAGLLVALGPAARSASAPYPRTASAAARSASSPYPGAASAPYLVATPGHESRLPDVHVPVTAVDSIGMTVSDMNRSIAFYTSVLSFELVSVTEVSGREYELLSGVFGARMRVARLKLGEEFVELTEFLAPKGRPLPDDMRPNDRAFQHMAIIVSDMSRAYDRLREAGAEHASTGPQTLPEWNRNAAGIAAFYFRDPDRHFLEILQFPPGKGAPKWHRSDRLFLGLDHTAIVVHDTDAALRLYRDALRMNVAGSSENYETEQEHLNNVFGARLRITTLRTEEGPGIELLEYLAPRDGRPAPHDLRANDLAHWQTTLLTEDPDRTFGLLPFRLFGLVSPRTVTLQPSQLGFRRAVLVRDHDGHGIRLASR